MADDDGIVYPNFGESTSSGGEGPTGTEIFFRLVDSRIDASEQRMLRYLTDTKADLLGLINARSSRVDVWGGVAIVIGTFLAVLSFGGDRFDGGVQLQGSVSEVVQQTIFATGENAKAIEKIVARQIDEDKKLDRILGELETINAKSQAGSPVEE